jgi:hypothetical protein
MPKRVIDFDAMWGSDKLAACAEWAHAEYAWFYGLADASGSFELTNLRVIWGRVAAIRRNLTIERLEQVFDEFRDKGLLFVWEENGKRYGHWTGSDAPGRLPPPSWRARLERLAPPVPKQQLAEFMSGFARGRAASPGGGFRFETRAETDKAPLKPRLEEAQAQDWNWDRNWEKEEKGKQYGLPDQAPGAFTGQDQTSFSSPAENSNAKTEPISPGQLARSDATAANGAARAAAAGATQGQRTGGRGVSWRERDDRPAWLLRELRVGQGPSLGPARVKPEALERFRAREAKRLASGRKS